MWLLILKHKNLVKLCWSPGHQMDFPGCIFITYLISQGWVAIIILVRFKKLKLGQNTVDPSTTVGLNCVGPLIHGFFFNKYTGKIFWRFLIIWKKHFLVSSLLFVRIQYIIQHTKYVLTLSVIRKASNQQQELSFWAVKCYIQSFDCTEWGRSAVLSLPKPYI